MRRLLSLAMLIPLVSLPAQEPLVGYSAAASDHQRRLETELRAAADTGSALHHMEALSSAPHVAGTPAQTLSADHVLRAMAEFGLDTSRVLFRVFLPYQDSARLELVAPDQLALDVTEPAIPGDRATQGGVWTAMNGYSGAGDVTGPVVFANYGLPDDYAVLDTLGQSVEGAVVIARYGKSFRGIKAREAEARGAMALVLYSDPRDDGFFRGDVYPDGPMRPPQAVQRGSLYNGRGDPSTPGWPSTEGARRLPADSMAIPTIPVLPIGYANAEQILGRLKGQSVPQEWQGGLPFRYHLGDGSVTLRVAVWPERGERAYKTVMNTFGVIRGSVWPDELVIAGGHRDAWGPGAVDNVSGIVSLLEAARAWGTALDAGFRPRRTIVLATWDAEEWGLVGSVEWVEAMADTLQRHAVAYLNQDVAVAGRNFSASGSASLHRLMYHMAGTVRQPGDTVSVYAAWRHRLVEDADDEPKIGNLGGGSDFAGFYNHLGIPSFGFGFGGPYGVYHSAYDSYEYMTRFSDPGGLSHAAAGALVSVTIARLANAEVIPFDYHDYGRHLASIVEPVRDQAEALGWDAKPFEDLLGAAEALTQSGTRFNEARDAALAAGSLEPALLAEVNAALRMVERHMVRPTGLVGRPWMRNLVFASDRDNGYATIPLPSVSEAIRSEDEALMRREIEDLAARIRRAAAAVDRAREELENKG